MTSALDIFRSLSVTLDALVLKVDSDLPLAEDIHPAIHRAGVHAADMVKLPAALAKLESQQVSAEASIPARETAVRRANHEVTLLEARLKKLGERIDRNRRAASNEEPATVTKMASDLGVDLPATRQDLIESLRKEILATEDELAEARVAHKRAESARKGAVTRAANLPMEIAMAMNAIFDHDARLEETIKALRKVIDHLKHRQEKRDRKRDRKVAAVLGDMNADGSPTEIDDVRLEPLPPRVPSDEDIRKMAEARGLTIDGPDDLEAARQLFA